jgi:hypothetical protein
MKTKIVLAVAIMATALLGTAAAATADSASITPGGNITSNSLGRLTFVGSDLVTPECNVQLRGSLTRSRIAKVSGTAIGSITGVTISNCQENVSASVLGLPWTLRYVSIAGTLPNGVTGLTVSIDRAQFAVTVLGIFTCLSSGVATGTMAVTGSNPYVSGLFRSDETRLPTTGFLCPSQAYLSGTLGVTPTQTVTRL